jgi:DNA repair exonuclease SbcCD ATPase subunit
MTEVPKEAKEKKNKNKALILAAIAFIIIVNSVKFYFDYQKENELRSELMTQGHELEETQNKLESISNELDLKIEEIKKLGGDVEELTRVREELTLERNQLKASQAASYKKLAQLNSKLEGYETLLKEKDAEIVKLKTVNKELLSENTQLKTSQNKLSDSLSQLSQTKQALAEKVALASRLKAENVKIFAINNRGKERESEFKNRQIDKIRIEFNLAENSVAPIEGKNIMIKIVDPDNNVLFDVASGAGTFMYEGREQFYTARQEILFDNTQQKLNFLYEKGSDFAEGKYNVEIFADGYTIGNQSFIVK